MYVLTQWVPKHTTKMQSQTDCIQTIKIVEHRCTDITTTSPKICYMFLSILYTTKSKCKPTNGKNPYLTSNRFTIPVGLVHFDFRMKPSKEPYFLLLPPKPGREPYLLLLPPEVENLTSFRFLVKQVKNLTSFLFLLKQAENLDLLAGDPSHRATKGQGTMTGEDDSNLCLD
ncbi:hypothetical protein IEQ34_000697 [Dendrobium chrysotoxum]|uniref:Uncharacterized protein n=1 Tax=Dendrobium chrysotoxum TaxID=161865 RepID=A0AAV7HT53_DENCH|nr:hypothetical protein IEQ34_000697 [Dendrobium chrysotoxum]